MIKKIFALGMLLCTTCSIICMTKQEYAHHVMQCFIRQTEENSTVVRPLAQEIFNGNPFMNRQQFIAQLRPTIEADKRERAAIFPLTVIKQIWHEYAQLNMISIKKHLAMREVKAQPTDNLSRESSHGYAGSLVARAANLLNNNLNCLSKRAVKSNGGFSLNLPLIFHQALLALMSLNVGMKNHVFL